jgi:hypothetical protein
MKKRCWKEEDNRNVGLWKKVKDEWKLWEVERNDGASVGGRLENERTRVLMLPR